MSSLNQRIALITGSTRGIGLGIAVTLAQKGAKVILNSPAFDPPPDELLASFQGVSHLPAYVEADVSHPEEVAALFERIEADFGRLDMLINNAGTSQSKDIFEITDTDWQRILETNLSSGYYCSKHAMELMKKQRHGRIIFITSMVAHQGALFGHAHYASSKSGQLGLMKTLARTGAPLGVTVNAVAPGIVATELLHATHGDEGVAKLAATIPLGLGNPADIGYAVAFLCSDEAAYITGATLDVNGGAYIH